MKKFLIILLLFLCIGCNNRNLTEVTFFKIGKADSFLITNNKVILIDAGEFDDSNEIIDKLNKKNIKKIDYFILSHYDKDHIGGAASIINNFDIGQIIGPDYEENSEYYESLIQSLNNKKIVLEKITDDIKSHNLEIITSKKSYINENDMSLIVKMKDGQINYLFLGDVLNSRINDILDLELESDLVKIPHHGKYESNSDILLNKIKPKYSIITCSDKNKEDAKIIDILNDLQSETLLTRNGDITCISDGKTLSCKQKN